MSRRRPQQPVARGPGVSLPPRFNWTDLVDDADLGEIASMLRGFARHSCAPDLDAATIPALTGDDRRDIDAVDAWLVAADAPLDLEHWTGRRRWCWNLVLNRPDRPPT